MSVPEFVVISVGPDDSDEEDEESGCTRAAAAGTSWSSAGRAELSWGVWAGEAVGSSLRISSTEIFVHTTKEVKQHEMYTYNLHHERSCACANRGGGAGGAGVCGPSYTYTCASPWAFLHEVFCRLLSVLWYAILGCIYIMTMVSA